MPTALQWRGVLTGFRGLALEVWFLERAESFYRDHLELEILERNEREITVDVGAGHVVRLREPGPIPRGGIHVHYALRTASSQYDAWWDSLAPLDPEEHEFGSAKSLYVYDEDDHCVELAGVGDSSDKLDGVFEVVLEVESLSRARSFYTDIGFEVVDVGEDRERVRLDGPIALELWTPQRGIADARGGVHCDLTFTARDPEDVLAVVSDRVTTSTALDAGHRFQDPDGHYLTILPAMGG